MPLYKAHRLRFEHIDTTPFVVVGGAGGWVDTDVSALGIFPNRLWLISAVSAAGQNQGARAVGEAQDPHCFGQTSQTFLSRTSGTGHMELYRDAGNNTYNFIGYFEDVDQ